MTFARCQVGTLSVGSLKFDASVLCICKKFPLLIPHFKAQLNRQSMPRQTLVRYGGPISSLYVYFVILFLIEHPVLCSQEEVTVDVGLVTGHYPPQKVGGQRTTFLSEKGWCSIGGRLNFTSQLSRSCVGIKLAR